MPIEVSPAPFRRSMQLPYTPMFIPEHAAQAVSGVSNGPGSAAASSIIPPNPGGVASPHHAIPALAEAGYAAPTIRPASMMLGGAGDQLYGSRSIIHTPSAGGSMYEPSPRLPPPNPGMGHLAHLHTDGHGYAPASLPAPRAAPKLQASEAGAISPSHHHRASSVHHHHHHHHHGREDHRDDDATSDASYYARPKVQRHRSSSAASSECSTPREEARHHRTGSMGHHAKAEHGAAEFSPSSPSPLSGPQPQSRERERDRERERHESKAHHHRHQSGSHLRPPSPAPESVIAPRRRSHSHSHSRSHSQHSHAPAMSAAGYPVSLQAGGTLPVPGVHPHDIEDPYRRRAVSMQFDQGLEGGPSRLYQAPSIASGGEDLYDDGASIAGSGMTFMDGPVDGRTSQYGLPRYAHQMKPDYRRFCVQRGNADVFLD